VAGLTDLALGPPPRDLPARTRTLDGERDPAHHERGDHQLYQQAENQADDRADDRADHYEPDDQATHDGGKLVIPAHPPHPL